jgi:toxin ParE1/3/4
MARYRLSDRAAADIASILRASEERHSGQARARYRALLTAAMRRVAAEPEAATTVNRSELSVGLRSYHIRHSRGESREAPVARPVHLIFYRVAEPGVLEIVRVLHERMDPRLYFDT